VTGVIRGYKAACVIDQYELLSTSILVIVTRMWKLSMH